MSHDLIVGVVAGLGWGVLVGGALGALFVFRIVMEFGREDADGN